MKIAPKLAIVTTLRAPENIIQSFVNYHLNIGIDQLFLFFDDPNDPSIIKFSNHPKITTIKCTNKHWEKTGCHKNSDIETRQTHNADLALSQAKKQGIDWITHIDIDELIHTEKKNIKEILSTIDQTTAYLWMQTLEAIPTKLETTNPFIEINNFKIPQKNNTIKQETLSSTLFHNEYFRGHIGGKSFTRTRSDVKSLKIHRPEPLENHTLTAQTTKETMLLHYDCYDYKSWLEKWERRYDGSANFTGRENRNKQFSEFKNYRKSNNKNDLLKFYKKLYLTPEKIIKQLIKNNYARNINIDKKLFSPPKKNKW